MKGKLQIIWSLILFCSTMAHVYSQKSKSVLASGDWYKIAIIEDGVYRVDAALLSEMGLDVSSIDPRHIAIYGTSTNGMLPQSNALSRADDLTENAIKFVGQSDGSFDSDDYLLFYGQSSDHLSFDKSSAEYSFERNVYSDTAFYFLTIKDTPGERIPTQSRPSGSLSLVSSVQNFLHHELENNSIIGSGRYWYGERFTRSGQTHTITFPVNGIVESENLKIYIQVLSGSTGVSSFNVRANGKSIGNIMMDAISSGTYVTKADVKADTLQVSSSSIIDTDQELAVRVRFDESAGGDGYIDHLHVSFEKRLNMNHGPLSWFKRDGEQGYRITNANNSTQIWDISNLNEIIKIGPEQDESTITFSAEGESERFVAFNNSQVREPENVRKISNQNIHGLGVVDGIIITHSNFLDPATKLANFRAAHDGLLVEVVTIDQIYNEYSGGRQDVTAIRDFLKHQYDKYNQLKYALLFGDCSFDYKDRSIKSTNFVPVYESRNSLHKLWSYSSDDYFGFFEVHEGEWIETQAGDHTMEIGVGRIPIQTSEEGEAVVNKIIRYQTNRLAYGKWRNKITFIADDGDNNIHQQDANKMSTYVDTTRQELLVNKIFLDAYEQNQNRSPQASEAFQNAISNGNLIVNFTGHGNEGQLTHEVIFNEFMISELSNNILLPLFITATCQFGNYDDPNRTSGGEQMVLLPYGGAVALITATRPVFSNTNYRLNEAFYFSAMQKVNGHYKRLGDMMLETKNNSLSGAGNRNYALLGDPMMRISFPQQSVQLTAISDHSLDQLDTLSAFGKYKVSGEIQSGNTINDRFNGLVSMTVLDKPAKFQTLGDESFQEIYEQRNVLLFQGDATVTNGKFDIEFVVPKNIDYSFGEGKINFYALNNTSTTDAHGHFSQVIVGGSENISTQDKTAPDVELYLNDTTFTSGQVVGPSPLLLAHLKDENGINISNAGFGNEILFYLNDDEPLPLNEYYSAATDTYQEGWIAYPLDNLEPGHYNATLEVSDVFNNISEKSIEFTITEENTLNLIEVMSFPNPVLPGVNQTTITFIHDRIGEDLRVALTVSDLNGNEIFTEDYRLDNVSEDRQQIVWNLNSTSPGRVRKGIYIYRLKVQSKVDGSTGEIFRRIVILN